MGMRAQIMPGSEPGRKSWTPPNPGLFGDLRRVPAAKMG